MVWRILIATNMQYLTYFLSEQHTLIVQIIKSFYAEIKKKLLVISYELIVCIRHNISALHSKLYQSRKELVNLDGGSHLPESLVGLSVQI